MKNKIILLLALSMIIIFMMLRAYADDPYKPYLHNDFVPEIPDIGIQGRFNVELWPGATTYTYSIDLPPGTNNLEPLILLHYNNHLTTEREGIVGGGWEISQNYIAIETDRSFSNKSSNKFKLFLDGNVYDIIRWTDDGFTYHFNLKIEDYGLKIENYSGGNNTYGQYWKVSTKDGKTYRFGYNNNSELVSNLQPYVTRWYLDLVTDTHGNNIYYSYFKNPYANDSAAVYPYKIEYNNDKKRSVEFILDNQDSKLKQIVYEKGNRVRESRKIKEIQVKYDNSLVRKYILNYSNIDTNKSFLTSITLIGNDNSTSLSPVKFDYYHPNLGWNIEKSFLIPSGMEFELSGVDNGVRLVDLNRDGFVDLTKARMSYSKQTWLNNGTGWIRDDSWNLPDNVVNTNGLDLGVRLVDVNGDGLVDFIKANETSKISILNSVNGWLSDNSVWHLPQNATFVNNTAGLNDTGLRFADVNGDGLVDLLMASNKSDFAWINNGSGWIIDNNWRVPTLARFIMLPKEYDQGVRIQDVNGDGLPDLVKGNGTSTAWINNGSGWIIDNNWTLPSGLNFVTGTGVLLNEQGLRFADVNGDGLEDLIQGKEGGSRQSWINNGNGWTRNTLWDIPESAFFVSYSGNNKIVRIADVNGDGLPDLINGGQVIAKTFINRATKGYLLSNITNNIGGIININYRKSTSLNNFGNDARGDLGFNLWLAGLVTNKNGMDNYHNLTSSVYYMYSGGLYDYSNKKFRGFSNVDEIYSDSIIRHYFHQDNCLNGKENITEVYGNSSDLFQTKKQVWLYLSGPYCAPALYSELNLLYEKNQNSPIVIETNYSYDSHLNVIAINYSGNVAEIGDEKSESFNYIQNDTLWLTVTSRYSLYNGNGQKIKETFYSYDNLSYGFAPTKGDLTRKEDWLNTGNNTIQKKVYDTFGNIIESYDENNYKTSYVYGLRDTTYTFVDRIVNAKNHIFNYWYDLSLGKIVSETDANNYATNYSYDVLGRPLRIIRPYDYYSGPYDLPTVKYQYNFSGTAPEMVYVRYQRTTGASNGYETRYFYDGLGNLIQEKSFGSAEQQITKDYYYDARGRVTKISNPYYAMNNYDEYATPNQTAGFSIYQYDSLSRIIGIVNPDNTQKNTTYKSNKRIEFDENGNRKEFTFDVYGRITSVTEYIGNNYYTTYYKYDVADEMVQITDIFGKNLSTYEYDSLGRLIKEFHIDGGNLSYSYDAAGNLINKTDSLGVKTYMTYDELNRVVQQKTQQTTINYSYDAVNGTLKSIIGPNFIYNYTGYDQRRRNVNLTLTIDGKPFRLRFGYNSMDKIVEEINPDGAETDYIYEGANILTDVRNNNQLIVGPNGYFPYSPSNQPTGLEYYNGINVTYAYNSSTLRLINTSISGLRHILYNYDKAGNLILINNTKKNLSETIFYDNLNRLSKAERKQSNNTLYSNNYTYGIYGNILNILGDNITAYYYNILNAPLKITKKKNTPPLLISFVSPTLQNGTTTSNTSIQINVSITGDGINKIIHNWNGTNYTIYDSSVIFMMNLNNNSALGENATYFVDNTGKYNGTCSSGTTCPIFNSSGRYGAGYTFDGSNDKITVSNFNMSSNYFTLAFWFKTFSNTTVDRLIEHSWTTGTFTTDLSVGGAGRMGGNIYNASGFGADVTSFGIATNRWYYAVYTYNGSEFALYRDGVKINISDDGITGPLRKVTTNLLIGSGGYTPLATLDEILIFNRSLSSNEINQLYMTSLYKHNQTQWYLFVNQSKNPTTGLDNGLYTYQAFATNLNGKTNSTDKRYINISSSGQISITSCQILNESKTYLLTQNILNYTGSCFNITANNVNLDGQGYTIDGDDSPTFFGVFAKNVNNIKIMNLNINDFTFGISFENVTNSTITNIVGFSNSDAIGLSASRNNLLANISGDSNSDTLYLTGGGNNTFLNISSKQGSNSGIYLDSTTDNNFTNLNATETNPDIHPALLSVGTNDRNYFIDSKIASYNILSSSKLYFKNTNFGEIKFLNGISGAGANLIGVSSPKIVIANNLAFVDSLEVDLNKSANISFYNLPTNFTNPKIYRSGVICPSTICYNFTSLNAGNITFNVTGWSNYTIGSS